MMHGKRTGPAGSGKSIGRARKTFELGRRKETELHGEIDIRVQGLPKAI